MTAARGPPPPPRACPRARGRRRPGAPPWPWARDALLAAVNGQHRRAGQPAQVQLRERLAHGGAAPPPAARAWARRSRAAAPGHGPARALLGARLLRVGLRGERLHDDLRAGAHVPLQVRGAAPESHAEHSEQHQHQERPGDSPPRNGWVMATRGAPTIRTMTTCSVTSERAPRRRGEIHLPLRSRRGSATSASVAREPPRDAEDADQERQRQITTAPTMTRRPPARSLRPELRLRSEGHLAHRERRADHQPDEQRASEEAAGRRAAGRWRRASASRGASQPLEPAAVERHEGLQRLGQLAVDEARGGPRGADQPRAW